MKELSTAIFNVMNNHAPLTALLGTWFDPVKPSIFVKRPIPSEALKPIIIAATIVSDVDADLLVHRGREIQRDIVVYGKAPDQYDDIIEAAEIVRNLFHQTKLAVSGWHTVWLRARGPIDGPAEPQEVARVVTILIRLAQE
jgi:hypothetical protein